MEDQFDFLTKMAAEMAPEATVQFFVATVPDLVRDRLLESCELSKSAQLVAADDYLGNLADKKEVLNRQLLSLLKEVGTQHKTASDLESAVEDLGFVLSGREVEGLVEVAKSAGLIAHVSGASGSGKSTVLNRFAEAHPGAVVKDIDDLDYEAKKQLGYPIDTKLHTPEMSSALATKKKELSDAFVGSHGNKPVVLAGIANDESGYDTGAPNKLMLNTSPLNSTIRAYKRDMGTEWANSWWKFPKYYFDNRRIYKNLESQGYEKIGPEEALKRLIALSSPNVKEARQPNAPMTAAGYVCETCGAWSQKETNAGKCEGCSGDWVPVIGRLQAVHDNWVKDSPQLYANGPQKEIWLETGDWHESDDVKKWYADVQRKFKGWKVKGESESRPGKSDGAHGASWAKAAFDDARLREAKRYSDLGTYEGYNSKSIILRDMIANDPSGWIVDSDDGGHVVGITHIPSKWKFHLPRRTLVGLPIKGYQNKPALSGLDPSAAFTPQKEMINV